MAYVSLYRKYRPQTFEEVVGQDHVTRTIVNALTEDRLHHAWLFTGPRGTGKTSTARILAKSVNCEQGPTATPCNACRQCTEITDGSSVDVIELDMASHGGVDDARELRDRALFAPATARKKVYILDEVHMASTAAFNALLKLIEEPPDHVIFTMATTDPQKVIPTIMSRVQRLDLRRVPAPAVAAHVREIVEREQASIEDAAVDAVVRAGDGSVRDTLSVLEQVLSFSGGKVTGDHVAQVLGHTPFERTAATVDAVAASDLAGALGLVQELVDDGLDLRRFAFDLVQHLRDLVVLQVAPDRPDLVDATEDRRARLAEQAGNVDRGLLVDAVDLLAGALTEMRQGPPRLPLELVLAKLTVGATPTRPARAEPVPAEPAATPPQDPSPDDGVDEPADGMAPDDGPDEPEPAPTEPSTARDATSSGQDELPPGLEADYGAPPEPDDTGDLAAIQSRWDGILEGVRDASPRIHAIFQPATPVRLQHGILTLAYGERYRSFHAENAKRGDCERALADAVERACGVRVRVDTVVTGDAPRRPQPPPVAGASGSTPTDDPPTSPVETSGPVGDEEADVREAEDAGPPASTDDAVEQASTLLVRELGATEVAQDEP